MARLAKTFKTRMKDETYKIHTKHDFFFKLEFLGKMYISPCLQYCHILQFIVS